MLVNLILMVLFCYLAIYLICSRAVDNVNTQQFVTPNGAEEENKPEDDLPPYTPPTPKTQAAMAAAMMDLPPSYEETMDISEVRISFNETSYAVNNNNNTNNTNNTNANANTNTSNDVPETSVVNPNPINNSDNVPTTTANSDINAMPEIVVDPINTHTTTTA